MYSRFHRHFSFLILAVAALLAATPGARAQNLCDYDENIWQGPKPPGPTQVSPPYFKWQALGRGDQRIASACPQCLVQHSGLVAWKGEAAVDDQSFAQSMAAAMKAGDYVKADFPMVFVFGQCYGGGMIDDLTRVLTANPLSIVSSAFFNQTSYYPIDPGDGGNGTDFVWAWIRGFQQKDPSAQKVAAIASQNDPFGWAEKPDPARTSKLEVQGIETPEYYSQNNGDTISLKPRGFGLDRVILWAGQPRMEDDEQLNETLHQLIDLGFSKNDILILYADGKPKNGYLIKTMKRLYGDGAAGQNHLKMANLTQLKLAFDWAFPADPNKPRAEYFFFLSVDHGCNNAFKVTARTGNGGEAIEGGGDWGGGDNQTPPSN